MSKWIVAIIQFCVQRLDYIWPKDDDLWVFGSNNGRKIDGNPKAIYDSLQKPNIENCYFITNDPNPDYQTLPFKSLKPLFIFLKAKNVVISHGLWDTGFLKSSSRKRVIQTWHGIPVKRIGFETPGITKTERSNLRSHADSIDYFMVSSRHCAELFHETLHIPKSKFLKVGQPRNDMMVNGKSAFSIRDKFGLDPDCKLVLYAPTFRKNGDLPFFQFPDFDLGSLRSFLESENIILLLRPHISDSGRLEKFLSKNIFLFSSEQQAEINEVLFEMDGLITDYSSIFIDYLLLNRPIFFTCFDYENYIKNERGDFLEKNYLNWIPGSNILSQKEFSEALRLYKNPQFDKWKNRREELKHKYHENQTASTTKNLLNRISGI